MATAAEDLRYVATAPTEALLYGVCKRSLYAFVKQFWSTVESQPFVDNWHIKAICEHLEAVTKGTIKRLVVNVPPGCSKSLLTSVFWPAWEWANNPTVRFFCSSYDQKLSTRDSVRMRALIESSQYRAWFGQFTLSRTQDQKTYYENSRGGWRLATSVGGHGTGEHPDRVICFPAGTPVLTRSGSVPIEQIRVGDQILSCEHADNLLEYSTVSRLYSSWTDALVEIQTSRGIVRMTPNHPVYVVGAGYIRADKVVAGDEVVYASPRVRGLSESFLRHSFSHSQGMGQVLREAVSVQRHDAGESFCVEGRQAQMQGLREGDRRGLGDEEENGIFLLSRLSEVADEVCKTSTSRAIDASSYQNGARCAKAGFSSLCDLRDSQKLDGPSHQRRLGGQSPGESLYGVPSVSQQASQCGPGSVEIVTVLRCRSVAWSGEVFNLEVAKNNNYFAGGLLVHNCDDPHNVQQAESELERQSVIDWCDLTMSSRGIVRDVRWVVIMQRLHERDFTAHVLRKGGWVHLCLPMRYDPDRICITPLGIPDPRTEHGQLLFPVLFSEPVVRDLERNLGPYGVAGQLDQKPQPRGGGMFKSSYFSKRVKAAPHDCMRIRGWDRASTADGGCYTAGVLIAKDKAGHYYVEHCVHGQWEPVERNRIIRATALRDRAKYGPGHEPLIVVESEGGSSGKDSFLALAKELDGFRVKEDRPTGSKDTRAEPWSTQLAAGNVFLVEDSTWDLQGYVDEHCSFKPEPGKRLGKYKDQVDASSMSYSLLSGAKGSNQLFRVVNFLTKQSAMRFLACDSETLTSTVADNLNSLLISVSDPGLRGSDELPGHSLVKLLDSLVLRFADIEPADYQDRWEQKVEEYDMLPQDLIMTREHAKRLWAFILKKREVSPALIVSHSDSSSRALSLAIALCDVMGYRKEEAVYVPGSVEAISLPPNKHVYETVRAGRALVV